MNSRQRTDRFTKVERADKGSESTATADDRERGPAHSGSLFAISRIYKEYQTIGKADLPPLFNPLMRFLKKAQ